MNLSTVLNHPARDDSFIVSSAELPSQTDLRRNSLCKRRQHPTFQKVYLAKIGDDRP